MTMMAVLTWWLRVTWNGNFDDIYCRERGEGCRAYCHPDMFKPIAPLLYHNEGNGWFVEVSKKAGLDKPGKSKQLIIKAVNTDREDALVTTIEVTVLPFRLRLSSRLLPEAPPRQPAFGTRMRSELPNNRRVLPVTLS